MTRGNSNPSVTELRDATAELLADHAPEYSPSQIDQFTAQRAKAFDLLSADGRVPTMIFVCVHNAGRSQMSAGFARHLGGNRAIVFSGGSDPGPVINPVAVQAMAEVGIDISDQFPVPFTEEIVAASDVVVTMGCGDVCPYFPGKRYIDWELEDPHGQDLAAVRMVRDEIEHLVTSLLSTLGLS